MTGCGLLPLAAPPLQPLQEGMYVFGTLIVASLSVISNAHLGNVKSLARSCTGNFLFSGGEDGKIHMFDLNGQVSKGVVKPVFTWALHLEPVLSLAFEFPWLVASSNDEKFVLIDVGIFLESSNKAESTGNAKIELSHRMFCGFGCNLFSVAIGGDRIVCGDKGVVRVLNFSEELEITKRVQALRGARLKSRIRRQRKTPAKLVARLISV